MRRMRLTPRAYRRITVVAVFLLAAIIVTGGAVRLTGSGLGCPDWPTCEPGSLAPREATDAHAMVEFINRAVTGLVSVVVVLAVLGSLVRSPRRRDLVWLSVGLAAGVFAQAVLGGLVVLYGLEPVFVMGHFLLSMVLLADAIVLADRASRPDGPAQPVVDRDIVALARVLLATVVAVLVAGTVVTATGPHGGDADAERFGFSLPHVARIHGILVVVFLGLLALIFVLLDRRGAPMEVRRRLSAVLIVSLAQAAVGYIQYFNDIPELLVGVHIAGATAVTALTLWFYLGCFAVSASAPRGARAVSAAA